MSRPNIVFILIDDLGWADLGCYGSSFYETPNLDRLAGQGMRFTQAYAACPVCSPTRASLLSGKYPARVGVTNFIGGHTQGRLIDAPYTRHLPLEEESLARCLHNAGYATWHVGKWHLGGEPYWPDKHGFEANVGGCGAGSPKSYFSPYHNPRLADGPDGEYLTDRLTDEAIRLIRNRDGRPFFLNLWYYMVHIPIQPKPELEEYYRAKAERLGLREEDALEENGFFPCEHKQDQRIVRRRFQSHAGYAAMIHNLDENIGRLLDALAGETLAEETMVMFTSDNGGLATAEGSPTCNAPLAEGKGWMYDGGVREPLLVRYPGVVEPGAVCDQPVTSPDFYPTLLDLADLPARPEQHVDGVSFATTLTHHEQFSRDAMFWHYPHYGNQGGRPGCSMRWDRYKLIEFFEDQRIELYDMAADCSESTNLAAEQPDVVREMRSRLGRWLDDVDAKMPLPNPDWTTPEPSPGQP